MELELIRRALHELCEAGSLDDLQGGWAGSFRVSASRSTPSFGWTAPCWVRLPCSSRTITPAGSSCIARMAISASIRLCVMRGVVHFPFFGGT